MFKRIAEAILQSYRQETIPERRERMLPGALYGAIAASVYILTLSSINVITLPDLPLGIDWIRLLLNWGEFAIALALAGAIVGWFTEDYMGIVGGGLVMTLLLLVGRLIVSMAYGGSAELIFQSFITSLPVVGVCLLVAWALRVAINRHLRILQEEAPEGRRKQLVQLVAIVILVGLIPGALSRFDPPGENAIRNLSANLHTAASDPSLQDRFPVADIPALKDHFGMDFTLYPRVSAFSTGDLEVTIRFADGYTLTCVVPKAKSELTYVSTCNEGKEITRP